MLEKPPSHQRVKDDESYLQQQVDQCREPEGDKAHEGVVKTEVVSVAVGEELEVDAEGHQHTVQALHQMEENDGIKLAGGEHVLSELVRDSS